MKVIFALCLVAVVAAAPRPDKVTTSDYKPEILRYDNTYIAPGEYRYEFEQSDGNKQEQQGSIKNAGSEDESLVVIGSFSWVGPDGVTYTVKYTADENGYNPEIEQGPGGGVPSAVVASLLG